EIYEKKKAGREKKGPLSEEEIEAIREQRRVERKEKEKSIILFYKKLVMIEINNL
ncbi:MAG: hypothetical protein HC932_04050, partial [Thermales bacterium]|nr:hypothetical protein [Thermales bacterium]